MNQCPAADELAEMLDFYSRAAERSEMIARRARRAAARSATPQREALRADRRASRAAADRSDPQG